MSETRAGSPRNGALWIDTPNRAPCLRRWSAPSASGREIPTVYTKLCFISEGELPGLFREYDGVTISGAEAEELNGEKILRRGRRRACWTISW